MGAAYMAQGLITLAGSRMYTSMADTDDVIDDALNRFETVLSACSGRLLMTEQLSNSMATAGWCWRLHVHQPDHPDAVDQLRAHHRPRGRPSTASPTCRSACWRCPS